MSFPVCRMQRQEIGSITPQSIAFYSTKTFTLTTALNTLDYCKNYGDLEQLLKLLHCYLELPNNFQVENEIPKEFKAWVDLPKDVSGLALCHLCFILTCSWRKALENEEGKDYSEKIMRVAILEEDINIFPVLNRNIKLGLNVALSLLLVLNITECRETVKSNTENLREFWTVLNTLDETTCNKEIIMLKNAVLIFLSTHITCGNSTPLSQTNILQCWQTLSPIVKLYWLEAMVRSDTDKRYKKLTEEFIKVKIGMKHIEEEIKKSFLNYSATKEMIEYKRSLEISYRKNSIEENISCCIGNRTNEREDKACCIII